MELVMMLDLLVSEGYGFSLSYRDGGFQAVAWRKDWPTGLYTGVALPQANADSSTLAIRRLLLILGYEIVVN